MIFLWPGCDHKSYTTFGVFIKSFCVTNGMALIRLKTGLFGVL